MSELTPAGTKNGREIRIEGLCKSFDLGGNRINVLNGIDIVIPSGQMISIVGASGAGKSTFLHVLGTLDTPTSGVVWYGDTNVTALKPKELSAFRNSSVGFVFQFHHLLPDFSALENCAMPARIAGLPASEAQQRAKELLDGMGLGNRLEHRPGELSGGEQQRVAMARALVMKPMLLLADEPTGNLDTASGEAVHDLLLSLNKAYDMTVIIVTHNEKLASRTPRMLLMSDGRLSERN